MRNILIAGWLLLPAGAWAYHEGPGQQKQMLDAVDVELAKARKAARAEEWATAARHFDAALAEMPDLDTPALERTAMRLRVSSAKAKLQGQLLLEAREELGGLVDELEAAEVPDEELLAEAKEGYANAQYYYAYLLRLQGLTREEWEPEINIARQNFGHLAKHGLRSMDDEQLVNVEAAIQLHRLDLDDLQGLPLPSQ